MGLRAQLKVWTVAGAASLTIAAPAGAADLAVDRAVERSCSSGARTGGAGVATKRVAAPGTSIVTARLTSAGGNWDLAVFDAASGATVAASSFAGGDEVAEGFAAEAGDLIVQACRVGGSDRTADLDVEVRELTEQAPRMRMVRVATPTDAAKDALVALGLDLTEHGGEGFLDVVLHSPAEGALLEDRGFSYETIEHDLLQRSLAERASERRGVARGAPTGGLPSGRSGTYRRLFDYSQEMQALAEENPRLVRYFTLPFETYEGRPVEAIEIAPRVRRKDGRPTFAMMGAHHAREWPSSEHTIEFAYELINGWKSGKKSIRKLMRRSRVVFVPVVNPDGFNTSREAAEPLFGGGRDAPLGDETLNLIIPYEYQRKNCRTHPPQPEPSGDCSQPISTGLAQFGVDPNRNYGGFWGGPGASAADTLPFGALAQDYRGPAPFSEPETRNIRDLVSKRQVVTLITNHTFSNLVLHPPGLQSQGKPPDDKLLRRLADAMAAENGYTSQAGFELYDTSGTTEDWSYNATGGLGYTFEIGPTAFHPNYNATIAEYLGTTPVAGDGGGNRAAYLTALRSTVKTKRHSLIRGRAPRGAFLTLKKRFKTPTSPVIDGAGEEGDVILLPEKLKTTLKVRRSGRFRWHVNPSTRPLVDPKAKQPKRRRGKPSDPISFTGNATGAIPCGDAESNDPGCFNDHPLTVPGGKGIDNGKATVRISWATPASDWDMKVFRDTDGDGTSEGESRVLGSSASGPTTSEETTLARPGLRRGKHVVRVTNFAGVEPYDGRITFNKTEKSAIPDKAERWKLICRARRNGPVLDRRKVLVDRGDRVRVNLVRACS